VLLMLVSLPSPLVHIFPNSTGIPVFLAPSAIFIAGMSPFLNKINPFINPTPAVIGTGLIGWLFNIILVLCSGPLYVYLASGIYPLFFFLYTDTCMTQ
jgi:hypothetical protein